MPALTRRALAVALAWAVQAGCACGPPVGFDGGRDVEIVCPTEEEALATARPSSMTSGELLAGRGDGSYGFDLMDVDAAGSVSVSSTLRLFEVRRDGVQASPIDMRADGAGLPGRAAHAWSEHTYVRTLFPDVVPDIYEQRLRWSRYSITSAEPATVTDVIPEIDLHARFAGQPEGPFEGPNYDVGFGGLALFGDQHLWVIRQPRLLDEVDQNVAFIHLLLADGTEPFGPDGIRLRRPINYGFLSETTVEVGPDGSLWYLADWGPIEVPIGDPPAPVAPDGDRRSPRVVRVAPDGSVTISAMLADPGAVLGDVTGVIVGGHWSAMAPDGTYLLHLGVIDDELGWTSIFSRVRPDGSFEWVRSLPQPYACTRDRSRLLYDPAIQHDGEGGFVFAFTNTYAPFEVRVGRLSSDGDWTLGESGILLESFPPTAESPDTSLWNMDMDVDGEGGYFLLWAYVGCPPDRSQCRTCFMRYDERGTRLWAIPAEPVGSTRGDDGITNELTVRHDHHGGAWVMSNTVEGGALQHVDGTGRPLFWLLSGGRFPSCYGSSAVIAWPDPDAPPIRYAPEVPYEPRVTEPADAGLDAIEPIDVSFDGGMSSDIGAASG